MNGEHTCQSLHVGIFEEILSAFPELTKRCVNNLVNRVELLNFQLC